MLFKGQTDGGKLNVELKKKLKTELENDEDGAFFIKKYKGS